MAGVLSSDTGTGEAPNHLRTAMSGGRLKFDTGKVPVVKASAPRSTTTDLLQLNATSANSFISFSAGAHAATGISWRVEFELENWRVLNDWGTNTFLFGLGGLNVQAAITYSSPTTTVLKLFDNPTGKECDLPLPSNSSNVLVRLQKSTGILSCELWNSDGSGYIESSSPDTGSAWTLTGVTLGDSTPLIRADIAFFRMFTSTVAIWSQPPVTASTGDALNLAFGTAACATVCDTSANAYTAASLMGATIAATPIPLPTSIVRTANAPNWSNWISLRAGHPAQLDGSRSFSLSPTSSAVTYKWSATGPSQVVFSDVTSATPTVQGLIFGTYQFTLTVTDSQGQTSRTSLDVGAVATDDNHVVVYPDNRLYSILGPAIAFGYNPWQYVDYKQYELEEYWRSQFAMNGGTWDWEPGLSSVNGIPRKGTAYIDAGSNTVNGVGTNFADVFCGGDTTNGAKVTNYSYININVPVAGTAPLSYYRYIDHCNGQNQVVMVSGYFWETQPAVPYPGYSWGTIGFCKCGNWASANNTTSNLNYYDGQGLGNYTLYYRSGWENPHKTAQWVADHWYRNGFAQDVRDKDFVSAMIRNSIDASPAPVYDAWPTIRAQLNYFANSGSATSQISDAREDGSVLAYRAAQALLDPDATARGAAKSYLTAAYAGKWQPQQQPGGNWIQNVAGGDTSRTIKVTTGSMSATLTRGATFPAGYCGEDRARVLNTGSVSIAADRMNVFGSGVSFLNAGVQPGDIFVATGTLNGVPSSFVSGVASVTSSTSLLLANKWRGDLNAISYYRIYNGSSGGIGNSGYWVQYFVQSDNTGSLVSPFTQDSDNWYICSVVNGNTLALDKPYTGTTNNPYRAMQTQDLAGGGTQPFMMAYPEWAASMAAAALAPTDAATANGYNSLLTKGANWLWNTAQISTTGGLWYGVQFSNCQNLQAEFWPAFGCSGGSAQQNEDYGVETLSSFSRQFLLTGSATDRVHGDTLYNAAYAAPGFATPPGFSVTSSVADLLDCCDGFTLTKYYGQAFALGQAASWPAARLGGVQPPKFVNESITFNLGSVPKAASVTITVIQPNGVEDQYNCSSSPCQVQADVRQGDHVYTVAYHRSDGTVISTSSESILHVQ